jgi:hypothetical protein
LGVGNGHGRGELRAARRRSGAARRARRRTRGIGEQLSARRLGEEDEGCVLRVAGPGWASHDPWIESGSAGGPHALDETAGRDRSTSPRSDGPKSKRL